MQPPRTSVFLARDSYRRRRLADALRLLPVVGLLLFLTPLIGTGHGRTTAAGGLFIFAVWFGLIVAAFVLVRLQARSAVSTADPPGPASRAPGHEHSPASAPPDGP